MPTTRRAAGPLAIVLALIASFLVFVGPAGAGATVVRRRRRRRPARTRATGSSPPTAASSASATPAFHGSTGGDRLNQPIVGMAATADRRGLLARRLRRRHLQLRRRRASSARPAASRLNQPIVGMAATPTGKGYWLVAADGGIFSFGDAGFLGSTGAMRLNQPIVGMAAVADRARATGSWPPTAASSASATPRFYGSTGAVASTEPIVAMAADADRRAATGSSAATAASSPSATPVLRLGRQHPAGAPSSGWRPRPPASATGWPRRTGRSSTSATPSSPGRSPTSTVRSSASRPPAAPCRPRSPL